MMSLKTTSNGVKFETFSLFAFLLALASERIFIKTHCTDSGCVTELKMLCLQARPCIFQPGNFTGCGSEGVKFSPGAILRLNPFTALLALPVTRKMSKVLL